MHDYETYTGRGLKHPEHRRAYNLEAARIGWPMRICEWCGLETTARCPQRDGGAYGWYLNAGAISCGPCRNSEIPIGRSESEAKRGLMDQYFGPGEEAV